MTSAMRQHEHEFNQTRTTEDVVFVPLDQEREQLRQSILRDPAFEAWRQSIAKQRAETSTKVAINEAADRLNDYRHFIAMEFESSKPVAVLSAGHMEIEPDVREAFNPS